MAATALQSPFRVLTMSTSNYWLALKRFSATEAFVCFCTSLNAYLTQL